MIDIIDRVYNEQVRARAATRARERNILLPTFAQQANPDLIPEQIRIRLQETGLWDLDPVNLFRITWKNEPVEQGGLFGDLNYIEFPSALTGVRARIVALVGKWFPTGAHKVGAAYGCLVPWIVTGRFDPSFHKAVWPSTGNFCRGGAFDSHLLGCTAVAILPEEMSRERFAWLKEIGAEVIATPGCESNVKEIYDKCWELRRTRDDIVIFNQFEEFGNAVWHYRCTGPALEELSNQLAGSDCTTAAFVSATGSAGTIAAGDYLRTAYPRLRVVASEALQCPTLYANGFGGHRIEGIGDKHVPWIHNVKNTDAVAAIDDADCMRLLRLFNDKAGHKRLLAAGLSREQVGRLPLLGISSIANLLAAIKTARYYEMDEHDLILTVATDSVDLYRTRLQELHEDRGAYSELQAEADYQACLLAMRCDWFRELGYRERRAIHNLKYYTWVEQQQKESADLDTLWYERDLWPRLLGQADRWDELIREFNAISGLGGYPNLL